MAENDREIFDRLGRIEQAVARIDERTARHDAAHSDHERRIRALEEKEARRGGVMAALAAAGSALGAAITWVIHCLTKGGN